MHKKSRNVLALVEPVITEQEKIPTSVRQRLKVAASLKPGEAMMNGCLVGNQEAIEVRDAWRFQTSRATRCVVVSPSEYAAMVARSGGFIA